MIEIRALDDITRILPANERGEICVRGPQVMRGYLNREAETRDVFVDGALRTGDVGYLDADGYLYITDRIKDLIICSGYNVYPRVIEDALYEHPAVAEAIVIGIPDSYRGQAPLAFVTLRAGEFRDGGGAAGIPARPHLPDRTAGAGRNPDHPAQDDDRQAVPQGTGGGGRQVQCDVMTRGKLSGSYRTPPFLDHGIETMGSSLSYPLALWVLVTPAGLNPSTVLEQNLPEPSFTQDCVEFSECQVRD